jgi:hypothetical protein
MFGSTRSKPSQGQCNRLCCIDRLSRRDLSGTGERTPSEEDCWGTFSAFSGNAYQRGILDRWGTS